MGAAYAELCCRSHFSFLLGASSPEELVEQAARHGYRALAITDQDGVYGLVRAWEAARRTGLHLVAGSHVTVEGEGSAAVLLVEDLAGWRNLCALLTLGRRRCPKGQSLVRFDEVAQHAQGLFALWVGRAPEVSTAARWREAFDGRFAIGVARHRIPGERQLEAARVACALQLGIPVVAVGQAWAHTRARRPLLDVLTCIRLGATVEDAGWALTPNAERVLRPLDELEGLFADHPEWLAASVAIAERCTFQLDELEYHFPVEVVPEGWRPASFLRHLVEEGLRQRYGGRVPSDVCAQADHELALIEKLGFEGYFLTVWDIVHFARQRAILCQGRGSAANSVVCYALGITAIDPVRMDLLFERFVSEERGEPPDIDVDFEHRRREEVLQYVYERYGRDRAAMVCEVITWRGRSAVREVGKALGLSLDQVDRLAKVLGRAPASSLDEALCREAGVDPGDPAVQHTLALAAELERVPRHLGIHVGGFVITSGPLSHLVPVENAAMPGRTVIQWDKDDIDALGILKVDLLGLGMLGALHEAFDLLREHERIELSLDTLPPEDPRVYEALSAGDAIGVFQVESRAQMSMLPRLRPRCFYDLVVEVAIIRPGPIQGDMVHPYLRRRQGSERVDVEHPALQRILRRTYGVPLFQEQVMRLAVAAGGFTPGEADELRRAMGAWRRRGRMEALARRLIDGLVRNGVDEALARRIFDQVLGFGEYGFPESHAASFALLVYASAWLKVHYPAAFLAALLNSQPMGFYAPHTLVADAQRHGVTVLPVDVQHSAWDCTLERVERHLPLGTPVDGPPPWGVRLGLRLVRGLGAALASRIVEARERDGPFEGLADLTRRTGLSRTLLLRLAAAGALRSFGLDRRAALWAVLDLPSPDEPLLLWACDDEATASSSPSPAPPMDAAEEMFADYEAVGLSIDYHPMGLLREALRRRKMPSARELAEVAPRRWVRVAGMVTVRQRPATAKGTVFLTLEDETGAINVIAWPAVYERYRQAFRDAVLLEVEGTVQREQGVVHVVARRARPLRLDDEASPRAPAVRARNFH